MRVRLIRAMTFSAAHCNPSSPYEPPRRLHGHSFCVEPVLEGPVDGERGWLVDFAEVRNVVEPWIEQLDHRYLNEIEGLETADLGSLTNWLFKRLKPDLPSLVDLRVTIAGGLYFVPRLLLEEPWLGLPDRVGFFLESAHRLPFAGEGHKCQRIHGHSFRVEVGAGDLKRLDQPLEGIHNLLDHRYLNEIEGLENPTSENLAAWIWEALRPNVPDLNVVVVRESPECACIYRGQQG